MQTPKISVVVPFLNEEDSIMLMHKEIEMAMSSQDDPYEIIYINDGSTDGTKKELAKLSGCTVIEMRRPFGQTAAISAGISQSKGKYICTLDGDLQNDPHDLLKMLNYVKKRDIDFVIGWRKTRHDPWDKKIPSWIAYRLRQWLLEDGIHDAGCGIKVFSRDVVENIDLYGEMHRFLASLAKSRGFSVREMIVAHRARTGGKSKYGWKRGLKGFLDMLAVSFWGRYSARPLHILGGMGLVLIGFSMLVSLVVSFHFFTDYGFLQTQQWIIFSALMFILGVQMVISGLIADIAVKGYFAAGKKKIYEIKSVSKQ